MIDWVHCAFELTCDVCGETGYNGGFECFADAEEYKKEHGWTSRRYRGEWEDVCPECGGG